MVDPAGKQTSILCFVNLAWGKTWKNFLNCHMIGGNQDIMPSYKVERDR